MARAKTTSMALNVRNSPSWGYSYSTTALLDLAQNALDADRKRWLFAMLAMRQMSQELG